MNMYGIMTPEGEVEQIDRLTRRERIAAAAHRYRLFLLVVVLPVLLLSGYYAFVASDEYISESHYLVKSTQPSMPQIGGVGQMLGLGGMSSGQAEAMSVSDYLVSHDVVEALRKRLDLVAMFRRPEADIFSRLLTDNPTPERLLRFFESHVKVRANEDTGITVLTVRGFQPDDAYRINRALLELGEQRVNTMNVRSFNDSVRMARTQLAEAETNVGQVQGEITRFRQTRRDIDPQGSGEAQIRLVSTLQSQLAGARAQLAAMGSLIRPSSPQYVALAARVRSLESQVAAENGKLAGNGAGTGTIATSLGGYEDLKVRQEFAGKRYEAAAANLEKAREEALRQQLYVVRVVDPNMPVKSLYPQRVKIIATVLFILLLAYGIGWLLVAGVREHAA